MNAVASECHAQQATVRVFIAEDSRNVVDALAEFLAVAGHARVVGVAKTEAEALDWAGTHTTAWDLAIVDLILEQGSGFNVIRRLKRFHPAGHVVVSSGYLSDVIRSHCEALGADLVLQKEQNEQLASYVERLLASS